LTLPLASDPDGDPIETIAWWDPADLPGNPAIRSELLADIDAVMAALGCTPDAPPSEGNEATCPCGTPVVYDEMNGWQHADGSISHDDGESVSDKMASIAKAGGSAAPPKAPMLDTRNLTGVWAEVYGRRNKLLARHQKAIAAAWDACIAELGSPAAVVRSFRSEAQLVAKSADPNRDWRKEAGTAAALAWLARLRKTKGYDALVAALEQAIAEGMAEGEADALALAADKAGKSGFDIGKAFRAALARLQGDPGISRQAQDAADSMVDGAAGDVGGTLADQAGQDGSEADMTGAADDTLSGGKSRSVELGTDWALYAAILAGAVALYQRATSGGQPAEGAPPGTGPEQPPAPPPPPVMILLNFVTAGDSRVCATCQGLADNGPYAPQDFPDYPHARCRCSAEAADDVPSSFFAAYLLS